MFYKSHAYFHFAVIKSVILYILIVFRFAFLCSCNPLLMVQIGGDLWYMWIYSELSAGLVSCWAVGSQY
jgi:hypothetical protein